MTHTVIKDRLIRTLILAGIGICLGAIITLSSMMKGETKDSPAILNVAGVGGPWELKDHKGKIRTDKDFKNKYKLLYFGFTSCSAICPTELQKTATAYNELSDKQKSQIQLLFVTIDPERDTVAALKNYVTLFDPSLIGLTGTLDQIEKIKNEYKVYAAKVPDGHDYTMDHSSYIYFMTPDDQLIALFKTSDTVEVMEDTIRKYLKNKS